MYPINEDFLNEKNDPEFDHSFHISLKKAGYVFPETEEDLDFLIQRFESTKTLLPEELNNPLEILKRGLMSFDEDFNASQDKEVDANLAQAAREGGVIEDDVKAQMKKDRIAAENEGNREDK